MTQIPPKQVRGLEEALQELAELKEKVTKLEEQAKNFVTRDELSQLIVRFTETYQRTMQTTMEQATAKQ